MNVEHPWFRYEQSAAGRFTALPVSWEGWASTLALVGAAIAGGRYLPAFLAHFLPMDFARPIGIAAPLVAVFCALFALIKTKGQQV